VCNHPLLVAENTATEFAPRAPNQPNQHNIGLHYIILINRHCTLSKLLTLCFLFWRSPPEQHQTEPVSAKVLTSTLDQRYPANHVLERKCLPQGDYNTTQH